MTKRLTKTLYPNGFYFVNWILMNYGKLLDKMLLNWYTVPQQNEENRQHNEIHRTTQECLGDDLKKKSQKCLIINQFSFKHMEIA